MIIVPESANFLVEQGTATQLEEARENLTYVAEFNGVYHIRNEPYNRFKFVYERRDNMDSDQFNISSDYLQSSELN